MASRPTLIASVQRALNLVDAVGAADRPTPAKVLARQTGQPLSTTYHLLRTLVHEGYLRRVDGGYVLGDRIDALSRPSSAVRATRAHSTLRQLHDELGAAAYLAVLDDGEISLVDIADSPQAPRVDLWVGFHDAAHATALGKAVLSSIDEPRRRDYLAQHDLADLTPNTVTSKRALLRQLTEPTGVAIDREEYALGTGCVAAVVPAPSVSAAVAVSVPSRQLPRVLANRQALERAARLVAYAVEL